MLIWPFGPNCSIIPNLNVCQWPFCSPRGLFSGLGLLPVHRGNPLISNEQPFAYFSLFSLHFISVVSFVLSDIMIRFLGWKDSVILMRIFRVLRSCMQCLLVYWWTFFSRLLNCLIPTLKNNSVKWIKMMKFKSVPKNQVLVCFLQKVRRRSIWNRAETPSQKNSLQLPEAGDTDPPHDEQRDHETNTMSQWRTKYSVS